MNPIRVLHIVFSMNRAGLETMLMNYYRHIDKEKIQFDFLMCREEKSDYEDEIKSLGGRVYRVSAIRFKNFSRYIKDMNDFFVQHDEYKIVHSHLDALSAPALYAAKKAGVPVRIAHSHNNGFELDKKYPVRMIAKCLIPLFATDFWGCSRDAIEFMFGKGIDQQKTTVIPNAIDIASFAFDPLVRERIRKELSIEGKTVIGHVGRFCYQKNQEFLLRIFNELQKNMPQAVLMLVGSGDDEEKIKQLADDMGIADKVLFLGVRKDVSNLYNAMDIFVLPSRFEGFGMVLLEAQASGLPCIASDKVSKFVNATGKVKWLSVGQSAKEWADEAFNMLKVNYERDKTRSLFKNSDFEINNAAQALQQRYVQLIR